MICCVVCVVLELQILPVQLDGCSFWGRWRPKLFLLGDQLLLWQHGAPQSEEHPEGQKHDDPLDEKQRNEGKQLGFWRFLGLLWITVEYCWYHSLSGKKHGNVSDIATNLATRSLMTLIHVLQLSEFVLSFSDLGTKQPRFISCFQRGMAVWFKEWGPEPHRKIDNPMCLFF